jgi:hypothetical protein
MHTDLLNIFILEAISQDQSIIAPHATITAGIAGDEIAPFAMIPDLSVILNANAMIEPKSNVKYNANRKDGRVQLSRITVIPLLSLIFVTGEHSCIFTDYIIDVCMTRGCFELNHAPARSRWVRLSAASPTDWLTTTDISTHDIPASTTNRYFLVDPPKQQLLGHTEGGRLKARDFRSRN